MKQVLIRANTDYLFPLPQTYNILIKEINNKLKFPIKNINIRHKGQYINKNNFKNINDELNILDINVNLKGGAGFPNANHLIVLSNVQLFLPPAILTLLLWASLYLIRYSLVYTKPGEKHNNNNQYINLLKNIKNIVVIPKPNNYNFLKELFIISLVFYIFSVIPSLIISISKSHICPAYKINFPLLVVVTVAPLFLLFGVCGYYKQMGSNMEDPSGIYISAGIIFVLCGGYILQNINNSLKEWEPNDLEKDWYKEIGLSIIPISAIFLYIIFRILFIYSGYNFGNTSGLITMGFVFLSISYFVLSDFIRIYINSVSSPDSNCPQISLS